MLWNKLIVIIIIVEAIVIFIVEAVGGVDDQLGAGGGQHGVVPVVLLARPWLLGCRLEFLRRFGLSLPWSYAWGFGKWLRGWGIHKCCKT